MSNTKVHKELSEYHKGNVIDYDNVVEILDNAKENMIDIVLAECRNSIESWGYPVTPKGVDFLYKLIKQNIQDNDK